MAVFHAALKNPGAVIIPTLVCKAQCVGTPMILARRVQKGIYFLLNAISLFHTDKETAVCKVLPWCFWYICWVFPANTGQGCPTHPRQGIKKWRSPWVAPTHPPAVPTGRAGCQGAGTAPALHSHTPARTGMWFTGDLGQDQSVLLSNEWENHRGKYHSPAPGAEQLFGCVSGGAQSLVRSRAEPNRSRQSCETPPRLKICLPLFGGHRVHDKL